MSTEDVAPDMPATTRTPGYDVARALAIFGMVQVNFDSMIDATSQGPEWLLWLCERLEGRSAALFVVLAGVGISLRTRRVREAGESFADERAALLKRAWVLFLVGILNLHLWESDILHCYGVYLALGAVLLATERFMLWTLAICFVAASVGLQLAFDYDAERELWSLSGMISDIGFSGLHPVFPWMAFIIVGMLIGRLDLKDVATRRRVLGWSVAAAALGELGDTLATRSPQTFGFDDGVLMLLDGWPRPPSPGFVLAAGGTALAVICLCVAVTEARPAARWVVALTATGQMAFTLYVAHAVAIIVPIQHGLLLDSSLIGACIYSAVFSASAVAVSLWWRRRWAHGPLEALIRQVTQRSDPAPWGGSVLR